MTNFWDWVIRTSAAISLCGVVMALAIPYRPALATGGGNAVSIITSEDGQGADEADGDAGTEPQLVRTRYVFKNQEVFLEGWVEYNTGTCALVSSGTHTALKAPKYGKLRMTNKIFAISGGPCAGKKLPYSSVYYTWTDGATKEYKDPLRLRWKTPDGLYQVDTDYLIIKGPRIFFKGKDVTNTTQKVALGEKIDLTTTPTEAGQTQSWKVSAANVGDYTGKPGAPKGEVKKAEFTKSYTKFFWINLGSKDVDYTVTRKNGLKGTAHVDFLVQGPAATNVVTTLGVPQVITNNLLSFGNITTASAPGMRVTMSGGASVKPGKFLWVQLVDQDTVTVIDSLVPKNCSFGIGLDNTFPYDEKVASTNDSPASPLQPTFTDFSQANRFRMYLMWQSNTVGSIPVGLGHVAWAWAGHAVKTGVNWALTSSSKSATAWLKGNGFPLYNKVLNNGARPCH